MIITHEEKNRRLALLEQMRTKLNEEEKELRDLTVGVPKEAYAKLAGTLKHIAEKTSSRGLRKLCLQALASSDLEAIKAVGDAYYNDALIDILDLIEERIKLAREVGSELNALVGEVYMAEIQKLVR